MLLLAVVAAVTTLGCSSTTSAERVRIEVSSGCGNPETLTLDGREWDSTDAVPRSWMPVATVPAQDGGTFAPPVYYSGTIRHTSHDNLVWTGKGGVHFRFHTNGQFSDLPCRTVTDPPT
jgi:hypothetical protein